MDKDTHLRKTTWGAKRGKQLLSRSEKQLGMQEIQGAKTNVLGKQGTGQGEGRMSKTVCQAAKKRGPEGWAKGVHQEGHLANAQLFGAQLSGSGSKG